MKPGKALAWSSLATGHAESIALTSGGVHFHSTSIAAHSRNTHAAILDNVQASGQRLEVDLLYFGHRLRMQSIVNMLSSPDIRHEAFSFLSRCELDKLQTVNGDWRYFVEQHKGTLPLRAIHVTLEVSLFVSLELSA